MAVKTSEIVTLFQTLALQHGKISHDRPAGAKHFYRMELNEFAAGTTMFNGYNLILEVMPIKYIAPNRDNCFKIREVSFIIVKAIKPINKEQISLAFDETEAIMEDFLARLNGISCGYSFSKVYFDLETVQGEQVSDGKNFGMRCSIDLKSVHNLEVNADNWYVI